MKPTAALLRVKRLLSVSLSNVELVTAKSFLEETTFIPLFLIPEDFEAVAAKKL